MKTSKCKFCQKEFIKTNPLVPYCSPKCIRSMNAQKKREKDTKQKDRKIKKKEKIKNSMPKLREKCMDLWARYVKKRDGCCQYCGSTQYMNAHHIYSRQNQGLRFEEDNGITLCSGHHTMSSSFSAHKTPLEFIEFLEQKIGSKYEELKRKARQVTKIDEEYIRNKIDKFENLLK